MKELKITDLEQNQRLDKFLLKYFNDAPKSFVFKMLRKKRIKLNQQRADGSEMLQSGDVLQMYLADETMDNFMSEKIVHPAERHFGIVYEDDNLLLVSKPAGLLTHPEKADEHDTLIDQILYELYQKKQYDPSASSSFTPAVCNRLDRNTSGIVVAGKNLMTVQAMNEMIANRLLDKYYLAVVVGTITKSGEISNYLVKEQTKNQVMVLDEANKENGVSAVSRYRPLVSKNGYTLLEIQILTGRSHQIRAHMQAINHPIVGDRKYGKENINLLFKEKYALSHQFLHAYKISFATCDDCLSYLSHKAFLAPLPKGLRSICEDLFGDINFMESSN